jgi:hypothetical protein
LTTGSVTATQITTFSRNVLEEAASKILVSLDCRNVYAEEIPPLTTHEEFFSFLRDYQGLEQEHLEAWFISRMSFRNDPITRGTFTQYQQEHNMRITGWAWHTTFSDSYQYIQDKTEQLAWTLEKNKGFITSQVDELRNIVVQFDFTNFGEIYLYKSETRFSVLMSMIESGGRV